MRRAYDREALSRIARLRFKFSRSALRSFRERGITLLHAKAFSQCVDAAIRGYAERRNVIETHERAGEFKEP